MDVAHRSTRLGVWRCPGPGAEGLKGGARPLALITALSLGGEVVMKEIPRMEQMSTAVGVWK